MRILIGVAGILVILGIAFALSTDRRAIRPRVVGAAFGLQVAIAVLVLYVPAGRSLLGGPRSPPPPFAHGLRPRPSPMGPLCPPPRPSDDALSTDDLDAHSSGPACCTS